MKRILRSLYVVLGIVFILGIVGGCWYVRSDALKEQVRAQLEDLIGAPVEIDSFQIGFDGTFIGGLKVYEGPSRVEGPPKERTSADGTAWLMAKRVTANVTLWNALSGNTNPSRVILTGVSIELRLDAEGGMLTQFPVPVGSGMQVPSPTLDLRDTTVTFTKPNFPDFVVSGVHGSIGSEEDRFVLKGALTDETWGTWNLGGLVDPKGNLAGLDMQTKERVNVSLAMLKSLPFVHPGVWESAQIHGKTPANIKLRYNWDTKKITYHVGLEPKDATVIVPVISLTAKEAAGRVVIEDSVVTLSDVEGDAFEGKIAMDARLDFSGAFSQLDFQKIELRRAKLAALPKSWEVPKSFGGELTGQANLQVKGRPTGLPQVRGNGQGTVHFSRFRLGLTFRIDGNEIEWGNMTSLPQFFKLGRLPSRVEKHHPVASFAHVQLTGDEVHLTNIAKTLDWRLPPDAEGRVSWTVFATIPIASAADPRTYSGIGSVKAIDLQVGGFCFSGVSGKLGYQRGVVRFGNFLAKGVTEERQPEKKFGLLSMSGRAEVVPLRSLHVRLRASDVPIKSFIKRVPFSFPIEGSLSGEMQGVAPLAQLTELPLWNIKGTISARGQVASFEDVCATVNVSFLENVLRVVDIRVDSKEGKAAGDFVIRLADEYPFVGTTKLQGVALDTALKFVPLGVEKPPINGIVATNLDVKGTLAPWKFQAHGTTRIGNLKVQEETLGVATLNWKANRNRLELTNMTLKGPLGELTADGHLDTTNDLSGEVALQMRGVNPCRMKLKAIEGTLDGTIDAKFDDLRSVATRRIRGTVSLRSETFRWKQIRIPEVVASFDYSNKGLGYEGAAQVLGGHIAFQGRVPTSDELSTPQPNGGTAVLKKLSVASLLTAFGSRKSPIDGEFNGTVTYAQKARETFPTGNAQFQIADLSANGASLGSVKGRLSWDSEVVHLTKLTGLLAKGTVLGKGQVRIDDGDVRFGLRLSNVHLAALTPLFKVKKGPLVGVGSVVVRGQGKNTIRGSALVEMPSGTIYGISARDWRVPLRWEYQSSSGTFRADVTQSRGQVASGRCELQGELELGNRTNFRGTAKFRDINLSRLTREAKVRQTLVHGKLKGLIQFSARNFRSSQDIDARIQLEFASFRAAAMAPVDQIRRVLRFSPNLQFEAGQVVGHFRNNILRLQKLTLRSPVVQLFADGTVTAGGRLALNVTANTGKLKLTPPLRKWIDIVIPERGAIPGNSLPRILSFLGGKLVSLRVTGTTRTPNIQIRPRLVLVSEAIRFFLQ
ncbi:MAG: hypothetical protein ACFCD0_01395 [Gemmataceae bacterium]